MPYLGTQLTRSIQIEQIITIHYFEYDKNFSFSGEAHDFWEFVCVDNGVVEIGADDRLYRLERGDIIFHKPMEFHTIRSLQHAPNLLVASFICHSPAMQQLARGLFSLSGEGKAILSKLVREAQGAFSTPINDPRVEQLERAPSAPFAAEQLIQLYLEQFLIELIRSHSASSVKSDRFISTISHRTSLQQIVSYLEQHIGEKLTVEQICTDNMIGRSYLQELFNREFGCGVMQRFNILKIERAKQLIRVGNLSFSQIAYQLGFQSLHYFSRIFKQIVGCSPSQYAYSIKGISDFVTSLPSKR